MLKSNNFELKPTLYPSRRNKSTRSSRHRNTTKDLHMQETSMPVRKQGSSDWISRQTSTGHTKKYRSVTDPDFSNR